MVDAFLIGGENLEELALKEILRSRRRKKDINRQNKQV